MDQNSKTDINKHFVFHDNQNIQYFKRNALENIFKRRMYIMMIRPQYKALRGNHPGMIFVFFIGFRSICCMPVDF